MQLLGLIETTSWVRVMERENIGAQAYAYVAKSCSGQMATGTALGYQDVDYVEHPGMVKR